MENKMKKIIGLSSIFLLIDIVVKLLVKTNLVLNQSIKIIDFYLPMNWGFSLLKKAFTPIL